jgi:hypothetical protein
MLIILEISSSSLSNMGSSPFNMKVPVSLNSVSSNLIDFHSPFILARIFSNPYSFPAISEISLIESLMSSILYFSNKSLNVRFPSGSISFLRSIFVCTCFSISRSSNFYVSKLICLLFSASYGSS